MKPETVLKNLQKTLQNTKAEYRAAQYNRLGRDRPGVSLSGSGADYHIKDEYEYLRLIEWVRDMDRNDTVTSSIVDRAVNNVVQDGFRVDPITGSEDLNAALLDKWREWSADADSVDVSGDKTFSEIERLLYRSARIIDGDAFVLPLSTGRLQVLEAHRCRSIVNDHERVLGIRLDENRRPLSYTFTADDIDPYSSTIAQSDISEIPARDKDGTERVWHIKNPQRFTQTRGVTALAPVFDCLAHFEDLNYAKLIQAQVVSAITFIVQRMPEFQAGSALPQTGDSQTDTLGDFQRQIEDLSVGTSIITPKGTEIKPFSPNVPNSEYFEHAKMILQLICACVGVPMMVYLLDSSITNFSGWRGAIDQARVGWQRDQNWFIRRFHSKVWNWKVAEWLQTDKAIRRIAESATSPMAHRWNPPAWRYIEPSKEAAADKLRLDNRLTSPRRMHNERGQDYTEIIKETVADNAEALRLAIDAAGRLSVETGRVIDPMQLLKLDPTKPLEVSSNEG
jgi:lambda family phage portal protein